MDGPICMMNDWGFEIMIESGVGLIHIFLKRMCICHLAWGKCSQFDNYFLVEASGCKFATTL